MGAHSSSNPTGTESGADRGAVSEAQFGSLLAQVREGARIVTESERCSLNLGQRLRLQELERRMLWSLPARRRRELAGEGRLSVYQRSTWAVTAPDEVPWVNGGVPPWLISTLCDEPGEVVLWKPLAQVGGEQQALVTVAGEEVLGHAASSPE